MIGPENTTNSTSGTVAARKGKDFELLPSFSGSPRNLPNEVLSMILKLLHKSDLKSARCACKLFETLVSPLLFDKIYISPHRQNLDVFRQITEHSDLCRYPRHLVYDIQKFKANIDPVEYYKSLCTQLRRLFSSQSRSTLHHADKDIEGLMRMIRGPPRRGEDYSTCRVVRRGDEIYQEKAEEEDHYNSSGLLLSSLCIGLMKLPYLENVGFQHSWIEDHLYSVDWSKPPQDFHLFSSPLARAWSPFYLQPKAYTDKTAAYEFDNLISAFSLTKKPLRVLDAGSPIRVPYEKFYTSSHLSRTFRQHGRAAMAQLERLTLRVQMYHHSAEEALSDPEPEGIILSVDLLAAALHQMPGLRRLVLEGTAFDDGDGLISISELFQDVRLPALETLGLSAMLGSAADLLAFLRMQPRLRILCLLAIELSEGTWAGLVDEIRRWLHLKRLSLELPLRQGGVELWEKNAWKNHRLSYAIRQYVLYGGENPLRVRE